MDAATIVALAVPVLGFAGTCVTAWATVKKASKESQKALTALQEQMEQQKEHNDEQYLGILRLTIMAPEMPLSERLIAGAKYIKKGGNGDVKHYYERLVKEHTK